MSACLQALHAAAETGALQRVCTLPQLLPEGKEPPGAAHSETLARRGLKKVGKSGLM